MTWLGWLAVLLSVVCLIMAGGALWFLIEHISSDPLD